jgi:hypothetical protein
MAWIPRLDGCPLFSHHTFLCTILNSIGILALNTFQQVACFFSSRIEFVLTEASSRPASLQSASFCGFTRSLHML